MEKVSKDFEIKKLGVYLDLYLKSDTLLLADVFENFRKVHLKIYHLDPAKFVSAPQMAWKAALNLSMAFLTDIDMLLMFEKAIIGRLCDRIHCYAAY